jgi:menaquinone-dependent protoporphyrinogen oxidase
MRALIVYRSKYGASAECARRIAACLNAECDVADLKELKPDPAQYDLIIVGGSIYAGRMQRSVGRYCEKHRAALQGMPVGYYISCLYKDDQAREELESNFPDWLRAHASAADWLGGRIRLKEMSRIDKFLYTKIAGVTEDVSAIDEERIRAFCASMNAQIGK